MPTRKPAGTIMIGLFLLSSLVMGSAWAAASGCGNASGVASNPDSGLIETPRVACNRALSLHVHSARLADGFDGREPLPGHRWLLLEASFENHMPVDLILGLDYPEAVLIGSIERQLYLLVDDARLYRATLPERSAVRDSFVIPDRGDRVRFDLAYPVPANDIARLSLRYYHDQYQTIVLDLLDAGDPQAATASEVQGHDLLELAVHAHQQVAEFHGVPAPEHMQWLVVDLRGRSLWITGADARALEVQAKLNDQARLPRVLEYIEAPGLLQARVDGRHAYPRHPGLGGLPANPAFLPEFEAGGIAVFPVPADAERVELLAQFPQLAGREISGEIRPTLGFTLIDGPIAEAPETLLEIDDTPVPLSVHAIERRTAFAGHESGLGEELLRLTVSQRNVSATGGMMRISQRLGFDTGIELIGVYLRGPLALVEPYWLPPGGEARAFELLLRAPAGLDALDFSYSGVSGRSSHRAPLP